MSEIPTVNLDDSDAQKQLADIIRIEAMNSFANGEIDADELDEVDANSVAEMLMGMLDGSGKGGKGWTIVDVDEQDRLEGKE